MDCKRTRELLWDLYEGELPASVYKEVIAHICACPQCAREAQICQEVSQALAPQPVMKAPETAAAAVMTRIRPAARRRRVLRGLWDRRWVVGAAAAAAIIAVLGALGVLPAAEESAVATAERGAFARALENATSSARGLVESTGRSVVDAVDYRQAASAALPWVWAAVLVIAVLMAVVAFETWFYDRRLEAKFKGYVR